MPDNLSRSPAHRLAGSPTSTPRTSQLRSHSELPGAAFCATASVSGVCSLDAGWAIEIANTSTVNVTGLSAAITAHAGAGTLTYDLTGMSDTGTTCTASGANMATCSIGTLPGGTTKTLNVLVKTTRACTQGTTITGSANVTSTNASSQASSLTGVNVVVVPQGVAAVAVPNVSLASSKKKPSAHLPAKTTLKPCLRRSRQPVPWTDQM